MYAIWPLVDITKWLSHLIVIMIMFLYRFFYMSHLQLSFPLTFVILRSWIFSGPRGKCSWKLTCVCGLWQISKNNWLYITFFAFLAIKKACSVFRKILKSKVVLFDLFIVSTVLYLMDWFLYWCQLVRGFSQIRFKLMTVICFFVTKSSA